MNNLVEKCDLCSGWGLIAKQNNSHIQCPRCQGDALKKELDELNDKVPRPPIATSSHGFQPLFTPLMSFQPPIYEVKDGLEIDPLLMEILSPPLDAPRKRGRPRKEK